MLEVLGGCWNVPGRYALCRGGAKVSVNVPERYGHCIGVSKAGGSLCDYLEGLKPSLTRVCCVLYCMSQVL